MKKVAKGQTFSPKADTWNAFIDAAQFVRQRQTAITSSVIPTNRQNTIVKIRNKSGEDQNQLSVLGIDDLAIQPDSEETIQRFRTEQPVFDCKRIADIDEAKQHEMKFVVLVDPIKNNECGRAIVTGITWVTAANGTKGVKLPAAAAGLAALLSAVIVARVWHRSRQT